MYKLLRMLIFLALIVSYTPEESAPTVVVKESEKEESTVPEEDIELIALVTMAEAEGECEEGKRLVIDTILNRVDSEHFPDTVHDVIYQPNQFSSMWNGRVDRCEVREDICQLVREELISRMNYEVMFFTAGEYSVYGVPMYRCVIRWKGELISWKELETLSQCSITYWIQKEKDISREEFF